MGFLSILFILGLANPGGVVVTPVPGNVCLNDTVNQTVDVEDENCS